MLEPWLYPVLTAVAVLTGFIDAIAGGGGLIMMPALLSAGLPPHFALGTNKLQSLCGTTMALRTYRRGGLIAIRPNLGTAAVVFAGAAAGALVVSAVNSEALQLIVPLLLLAVALYVVFSPRMDDEDAHERLGPSGYAPVAGAIGFYDGFFGPGTGTFFAATQVGLRGLGLTRATAATKLFNATSNVASLLVFAAGGKVLWLLGLCMAAGAMAGSWLGSHSAMRHGASLIRPLLIVSSVALTARLLWTWYAAP
jgi:uncharacterized protein